LTVFVDTSYYIARIMSRDQWHKRAVAASKPGLEFITSSLVLNETVSLLQARGYLDAALDFLRSVRSDSPVQIIYPDAVLHAAGWDLFTSYAARGANAVDCVSFAIMRKLGVRRAFTFDAHFLAAGFESLR
jgi:predicted nucleic acid-binding protein